MRLRAALIAAATATLLSSTVSWAQAPAPRIASAPAPKAEASAQASAGLAPCTNPGALGVSRVVQIDTTGGPGFGFEHFKQLDFLRDKEVVLTFDDGPWPVNTPAVLKALADECTTGIFFPIGKHSLWHPEILKQVAKAGHVIGGHTWSHANLRRKGMTEEKAKEDIEMGFAAVKWAIGKDPAPFFRFPALQHPPATVAYLGERNVAVFSCDIDSFDFKSRNGEQVVNTLMAGLEKKGKGILLMHDFKKQAADALPVLLRRLKEGGYKVVAMKPKGSLTVIPQYEEAFVKEAKIPAAASTRPVSSVVQTISE